MASPAVQHPVNVVGSIVLFVVHVSAARRMGNLLADLSSHLAPILGLWGGPDGVVAIALATETVGVAGAYRFGLWGAGAVGAAGGAVQSRSETFARPRMIFIVTRTYTPAPRQAGCGGHLVLRSLSPLRSSRLQPAGLSPWAAR